MAVVQLMAWMTDLLVARLGRVPKLNYLKSSSSWASS